MRDERVYYAQNWRGDVSALLTDTGSMIEWVKYSAYGVPYSLPAGDTDSSGTWDAADEGRIGDAIGVSYDVRYDANLDGVVGDDDITHANSIAGGYQTLGRGMQSSPAVANRVGYAAIASCIGLLLGAQASSLACAQEALAPHAQEIHVPVRDPVKDERRALFLAQLGMPEPYWTFSANFYSRVFEGAAARKLSAYVNGLEFGGTREWGGVSADALLWHDLSAFDYWGNANDIRQLTSVRVPGDIDLDHCDLDPFELAGDFEAGDLSDRVLWEMEHRVAIGDQIRGNLQFEWTASYPWLTAVAGSVHAFPMTAAPIQASSSPCGEVVVVTRLQSVQLAASINMSVSRIETDGLGAILPNHFHVSDRVPWGSTGGFLLVIDGNCAADFIDHLAELVDVHNMNATPAASLSVSPFSGATATSVDTEVIFDVDELQFFVDNDRNRVGEIVLYCGDDMSKLVIAEELTALLCIPAARAGARRSYRIYLVVARTESGD